MIILEHAREEMETAGITEKEIEQCLAHGTLEIKQYVRGELRYGKKLCLKEKTFIVIYTLKNSEERIITAYPVWRKRSWQK